MVAASFCPRLAVTLPPRFSRIFRVLPVEKLFPVGPFLSLNQSGHHRPAPTTPDKTLPALAPPDAVPPRFLRPTLEEMKNGTQTYLTETSFRRIPLSFSAFHSLATHQILVSRHQKQRPSGTRYDRKIFPHG